MLNSFEAGSNDPQEQKKATEAVKRQRRQAQDTEASYALGLPETYEAARNPHLLVHLLLDVTTAAINHEAQHGDNPANGGAPAGAIFTAHLAKIHGEISEIISQGVFSRMATGTYFPLEKLLEYRDKLRAEVGRSDEAKNDVPFGTSAQPSAPVQMPDADEAAKLNNLLGDLDFGDTPAE